MPTQNASPAASAGNDAALAAAVIERLARSPRVPLDEIDVLVENGRVIIRGALPSRDVLSTLTRIVRQDLGVRELTANVRFDPSLWIDRDLPPALRRKLNVGNA